MASSSLRAAARRCSRAWADCWSSHSPGSAASFSSAFTWSVRPPASMRCGRSGVGRPGKRCTGTGSDVPGVSAAGPRPQIQYRPSHPHGSLHALAKTAGLFLEGAPCACGALAGWRRGARGEHPDAGPPPRLAGPPRWRAGRQLKTAGVTCIVPAQSRHVAARTGGQAMQQAGHADLSNPQQECRRHPRRGSPASEYLLHPSHP